MGLLAALPATVETITRLATKFLFTTLEIAPVISSSDNNFLTAALLSTPTIILEPFHDIAI